jgi:non-homologous end joining protein Ku
MNVRRLAGDPLAIHLTHPEDRVQLCLQLGVVAADGYALLRAALAQTERAAIGRRGFHDRLRTVVFRTVGDVLAVHTLRVAAELVDPRTFELPRVRRRPSEREVKWAAVQSAGGALAMRAYGM